MEKARKETIEKFNAVRELIDDKMRCMLGEPCGFCQYSLNPDCGDCIALSLCQGYDSIFHGINAASGKLVAALDTAIKRIEELKA